MNGIKRLSELSVGDVGIIDALPQKKELRGRLMDMGVLVGSRIECIGKSPLGDPAAFLISGGVIALRKEVCGDILLCCDQK